MRDFFHRVQERDLPDRTTILICILQGVGMYLDRTCRKQERYQDFPR